MKAVRYILPLLFVLLLALPQLNAWLHVLEFEQTKENRYFAPFPAINVNNLDAYPKAFDAYLNDAFSFRTPLLDAFKWLKFNIWHVSSNIENSAIGLDGWYFITKDEQKIVAGKLDFTEEELELFREEWDERAAFLDSLGITYRWLICPLKHYVYTDKLPFNLVVSKRPKRVEQLSTYLEQYHPGLMIDPTEALKAARDSVDVFYRLDNHWNYEAGYTSYFELMTSLKRDRPNLKIVGHNAFEWEPNTRDFGFHRNNLGLSDNDEERIPKPKVPTTEPFSYGFPSTPGFPYPWDYEMSFRQKDTLGLKILVIRDSFGDHIMPFVKESFSESVFIFDSWQYTLHKKIILQIKPDIVVFSSLETHLKHVIQEYPTYE